MLSAQIEKVLKEHLDELNDVELKTFQWYLTQHKSEGGQSIPQYQLEDATREATVDKMVQVYRKDGAVVIMVDILMRMNLHDLSIRLTQATIGANMEQQSHEPCTGDADWMTQDLSCSVCKNIFNEPVALQCGHSFCKTCIESHWVGRLSQQCPLCKQVMNTQPLINFTLKSLSEKYQQRSVADPSGGNENVSNQVSHETPLRTIKEKQEAFERVKLFCDSSIEHIKIQRRDTEAKIRADFDRLRLFLKTEEEARIAALEEEETEKIHVMQKIEEISRDTFSLSDTMKELEGLGVASWFIQNFKNEMERAQNALPNPELLPQAGINLTNHVENLQVKVLEKGLSSLKLAPVILIPEIECDFEPSLWPYSKEEEEEELILATLEDYQYPNKAPVILLPEIECDFEPSLWPYSKEETEDMLAILEEYQYPNKAPVILLPEIECHFESSLWPTSKEEEEDILY